MVARSRSFELRCRRWQGGFSYLGLLFALAVVCIEVGLQSQKGLGGAIAQVSLALLKNPLVVAPLLGALWSLGGLQLAPALDEFLVRRPRHGEDVTPQEPAHQGCRPRGRRRGSDFPRR